MSGKSPELEAILSRWIHAHVSGQGHIVRKLLSRDLGALYCGTAANELITGQPLQDGIAAHVNEIQGAAVDSITLHSYAWDDAGWAIALCQVRNEATETTMPWRLSVFFRLEDGQWTGHHAHGSYATDFHETHMGMQHSAFQNLLNAAADIDLHIASASSATVMFTDIVGSTSLVEALGDRRWTTLVNTHVAQLTAAIEADGGRMIKSLGDGTMSTFQSAGSAMRAAQSIQNQLSRAADEPRLQVRIGLHTGDVIEAGDDFFGTVVNKAARIAATAGPEEILVSGATRVMVGNSRDFAFSNGTAVQLKGLEGTHILHQLEWQR